MQRKITKIQGFVLCITNFSVNTRKTAKAKQTEGYFQARRNLLESYWQNFQQLHEDLVEFAQTSSGDEEAAAVKAYLDENEYDEMELLFTENLGELIDALKTFAPAVRTSASTVSVTATPSMLPTTNLPRIKIPTFDGNFLNWYAFKDLFTSVVIDNVGISNTQRLQYLKDALVGDAAHILDNIVTTDANFNVAWDIIVKKYENKRIIINSYLTKIINLPKVEVEAASALRTICDGVTASLRALEHLERPVEHWDDWLVFLVVGKLDASTRRAWELSLDVSGETPTFDRLKGFLNNRIQSLEIIQMTADAPQKPTKFKPTVKGCHTTTTSCPICSDKHIVPHCKQFKDSTKKKELAANYKLCFNCLRQGHMLRACPSDGRCTICKAKHNTMLHGVFNTSTYCPNAAASATAGQASVVAPVAANSASVGDILTHSAAALPPVLLGTALVEAHGANGHKQILRALIDNGSEATFISEYAARQLRLKRSQVEIPVSGASGTNVACAKTLVTLTVRSLKHDFGMECTALVLPRVGSITPSKHIPLAEVNEFRQLALADPRWHQPGAIDIILSAADYAMTLRSEVKHSNISRTVAQSTHLGWVILGGLSKPHNTLKPVIAQCYNTQINLDQTLKRFFEVEDIGDRPAMTVDEIYCESLFEQTTRRVEHGRYMVKLPKKTEVDLWSLAPSKADALMLFKHTQQQLQRDKEKSKFYTEFMAEYRDLGHMQVSNGAKNKPECYLPHHGVWKTSSTTTKLRVVFNAARKYSTGISLNDCLHTGPKLQNDLAEILVNWRRYKFAFTGDLAKMFRQVLVDPEDTNLQKIFWCADNESTPMSFTLQTVTYGTNCAPYLALKVLRRLANDERQNFPEAAKTLETEFYVGDVLSGEDTIDKTIEKMQELKALLKTGCFTLRKFNSNNPEVLRAIEPCDRDTSNSLELNLDDQTKALGITWLTQSDSFTYHITLDYSLTCFSKRQLASDVARIFDPLGLVAPVTIRGKIFLQKLWERNLDWNELLPQDLQHQWTTYRNELRQLEHLHVQRWVRTTSSGGIELHAFSDASNVAYAAAVYARVPSGTHYFVNLLIAKTKVAPIKQLTIPRLELCAARLAANLLAKVQRALPLKITRMYLWTDSATVLCWIRSTTGRLKQFVANRVTQIQAVTDVSDWRYIATKDNPADCASRGIAVTSLLSHALWWNGPAWLSLREQSWPQHQINLPENIPETRDVIACTAHLKNQDWFHMLLLKFSTLEKLVAVVGWCLRFVNNCKKKSSITDSFSTWPERNTALKLLIITTQRAEFAREVSALEQHQQLPRDSKLRKLNVVLYTDNILRLRGRLQQTNLPLNERCPMIMPKQHPLTSLIVKNAHLRCMHGGTQATLGYVRQQYWVIDGRAEVKRFIRRCVKCFRQNCAPQQQLMGDLPAVRCNVTFPFLHTGVDYAGPFNIRTTKGRGYKSYKGYVALFVCLATKAIHLELVSDMTTQTFILSLERFMAARGVCSDIYSDQGTTFVGADALLKDELHAFRQQLHAAASHVSQRGVTWHFIPPGAPNFGGLWEAGVKSMKVLLKRTVNTATLTFEEFYTVLKRVEACLNSRPLAALTDDPTDLAVLTPGHMLIGRPITSIPEPNLLDLKTGALCRWRQLSQMYQDFWRRWSVEYIQQLHVRSKWHKQHANVKVGQLVLIREEKAPPAQWIMGRIIDVHPGADGLVRVVSLKTATATIKRPISKISLLPIDAESSSSACTPEVTHHTTLE